jgi:hypothetical protein
MSRLRLVMQARNKLLALGVLTDKLGKFDLALLHFFLTALLLTAT